MKKLFMLFALGGMVVSPAVADYYRVRTNNCNPAAMHRVLDDAVRAHRAVITDVVCEEQIPYVQRSTVAYAPAPVVSAQPVYVPAPMEYIPVVDCVPYPTRCEYCGNM